jgi:hypothetical protein
LDSQAGSIVHPVASFRVNRARFPIPVVPSGLRTSLAEDIRLVYQAICEGVHGSSLGKLTLSMVVVQEDGSPCRIGSAIIRSFAYLVDSLFFGLIGYLAMQKSFQEQRNGDTWAHTVVCKRSKIPPENLRDGGHFIAVLLCAVAADAALVIVGLLLKVFA